MSAIDFTFEEATQEELFAVDVICPHKQITKAISLGLLSELNANDDLHKFLESRFPGIKEVLGYKYINQRLYQLIRGINTGNPKIIDKYEKKFLMAFSKTLGEKSMDWYRSEASLNHAGKLFAKWQEPPLIPGCSSLLDYMEAYLASLIENNVEYISFDFVKLVPWVASLDWENLFLNVVVVTGESVTVFGKKTDLRDEITLDGEMVILTIRIFRDMVTETYGYIPGKEVERDFVEIHPGIIEAMPIVYEGPALPPPKDMNLEFSGQMINLEKIHEAWKRLSESRECEEVKKEFFKILLEMG